MCVVKEENPISKHIRVKEEVDDGYDYNLQAFVATNPVNNSDKEDVAEALPSSSIQTPFLFPSFQQIPAFMPIPIPNMLPFSINYLLMEKPQLDFMRQKLPTFPVISTEKEISQSINEEAEKENPKPPLDPVSLEDKLPCEFPPVPTIKEEFPQVISDNLPAVKDCWLGEFVPNKHHPSLIYKFIAADRETGEGITKCYKFAFASFNKSTIHYVCVYCRSMNRKTRITALENEFLEDPLSLDHVCTPELYEMEMRKRERSRISQQKSSDQENQGSPSPTSTEPGNPSNKSTDNVIVANRVKHPAMYFRASCEEDRCWLFVARRTKKNGTYACNGCYLKGFSVKITVEEGKFCGDPSELRHCCVPLSWAEEQRKRRAQFKRTTNIFLYSDKTETTTSPYSEKLYDAEVFNYQSNYSPVLYSRSFCEKDLCWAFKKNTRSRVTDGYSTYHCVMCSWENVDTNIVVKGTKFCRDPLTLLHVCQPFSWKKEEALKIAGIRLDTNRSKQLKRNSVLLKYLEEVEKTVTEEPKEAEKCVPEKRIKTENECQ